MHVLLLLMLVSLSSGLVLYQQHVDPYVPFIDELPSGSFSWSSSTNAMLPQYSDNKAWCASVNSNPNDYVEADLGTTVEISALATKGRATLSKSQWVTEYAVQYSETGVDWTSVGPFTGNNDRDTEVKWPLSPHISARFLRFYPIAYNNFKCMRIEAYVVEYEYEEFLITRDEC